MTRRCFGLDVHREFAQVAMHIEPETPAHGSASGTLNMDNDTCALAGVRQDAGAAIY